MDEQDYKKIRPCSKKSVCSNWVKKKQLVWDQKRLLGTHKHPGILPDFVVCVSTPQNGSVSFNVGNM